MKSDSKLRADTLAELDWAPDIDGGVVTLRGKVRSWHERDAAQGAAWSVPGVSLVVDEMTVE